MSHHSISDNTDFGGCVILTFVFAAVIALIIATIVSVVKINNFDKAYKNGAISFKANYLPLGTQGNPANSSFPKEIPDGGDEISDIPRLYKVTGCEGHTLPEEAKGIYASSSYFQADQVEISVPQQTTGYVNICVPIGTQIDVVLWVKN